MQEDERVIYCRRGFFREVLIFAILSFQTFAGCYFRDSRFFPYISLLSLNFRGLLFSRLTKNRENRENLPLAKKTTFTVILITEKETGRLTRVKQYLSPKQSMERGNKKVKWK